MFVAGWRHALRSEWPFIIIIYYIVDLGSWEDDADVSAGVGEVGTSGVASAAFFHTVRPEEGTQFHGLQLKAKGQGALTRLTVMYASSISS